MAFLKVCFFSQGMLDNIEEQINDELNDEIAKKQGVEGMHDDFKKDMTEDPYDDEEIDTKANLHLGKGITNISMIRFITWVQSPAATNNNIVVMVLLDHNKTNST